ncbi:hypothetical protein BU23DRAFT_334294, partial [Bimuria novae-zelandiae CBS 107.79]
MAEPVGDPHGIGERAFGDANGDITNAQEQWLRTQTMATALADVLDDAIAEPNSSDNGNPDTSWREPSPARPPPLDHGTEADDTRRKTEIPSVSAEFSPPYAQKPDAPAVLGGVDEVVSDIDRITTRLTVAQARKTTFLHDDEERGKHLVVLCLDGGGVRSYFSLLVLEELMRRVNELHCSSVPEHAHQAAPRLEPSDVFDFIYGTSSGGLIAIMLGRLEMTVIQCKENFTRYADELFGHRRSLLGFVPTLSQPRYSEKRLIRATRLLLDKFDPSSEDNRWRRTIFASSDVRTKTAVVAYDNTISSQHVFRSHDYTPQLRSAKGHLSRFASASPQYIWQVARAASAAPFYFPPMELDEHTFLDGGMVANNPSMIALNEILASHSDSTISMISIGSGLRNKNVQSGKPHSQGLFGTMRKYLATVNNLLTDTEITHEQVSEIIDHTRGNHRYHRLNDDGFLGNIRLDDWTTNKHGRSDISVRGNTRDRIERIFEAWSNRSDVDAALTASATDLVQCINSKRRRSDQEMWSRKRSETDQQPTVFSLEGVPKVREFVDRPDEMAQLERVLLPKLRQSQRQKVHVLRGLGGIGKTQLAIEFARRHHRRFSTVFWLDGKSKDSVKRSIASYVSRIPRAQIPAISRAYTTDGSVELDAVVAEVMGWLARPDNTAWLLIFDNVDREYNSQSGDPDAYDVRRFFSSADHGFILITTRLARLEQLGGSQQLGRVHTEQAQAILRSWCKVPYDTDESRRLLMLLDGLPLAIAQAGAYLQESGVHLEAYLRFYEQQWGELMREELADAPLRDYPDRSVWTTWAISYQAIRNKHESTANLLLLWSFLDNRDLWYDLLATACKASTVAARMLSESIGNVASSELAFSRAMQQLRSYSLIEEVEEATSFATHPVVHQWAYHYQGKQFASKFVRLAIVLVGWAVPDNSTGDWPAVQHRLLPHAQAVARWVVQSETRWDHNGSLNNDHDINNGEEREAVLNATHLLGNLYADQGKLAEEKQMYEWSLQGKEKAWGPEHTSTLDTVNNLGGLYVKLGRLDEAEKMYQRALQGYEKAVGPDHPSTFSAVNNLGLLYADLGHLDEAEKLYQRALQGYEKTLGPDHPSTLTSMANLVSTFWNQGRWKEAEALEVQVMESRKTKLGADHPDTLSSMVNLASTYRNQGRWDAAEEL